MDDLAEKDTPTYVAPQIYFDNHFSGKCDIFSYGKVFYTLTHHGNSPYPPKSTMSYIKEFLTQIASKPLKCQINEGNHKNELSNLIERMLASNEDDRINFDEIFKHPVMNI